MIKQIMIVVFAVVCSSRIAFAGYKGSVTFTSDEKASHAKAIPVILKTAADCLQKDLDLQNTFFNEYGIAAFYGDRGAFSKLSDADKRDEIASLGRNPSLLAQMRPTSCVGMTMKCLGRGFAAVGEAQLWKRLADYTNANGVDGMALQDGLQKLGWKIWYWNPDVNSNDFYDRDERASHPRNSDHFWGYHAENWRTVRDRRVYYFNKVDDSTSLVNFGDQVPRALLSIPFFVGTAHMGYHVFPGSFAQVIEAHSTRPITDSKTVQTAPFNPLAGEAPTDGEYRSGLIAVPPGY